MDARKKLFTHRHIYGLQETKNLFIRAMAENCKFHYERCEPYKKIMEAKDFSYDSLHTLEDLGRLPFIPTLFFKHHELFSMPKEKLLIKATSSGTKGKKSHIGFDHGGLYCGLHMVLRVGHRHQLFSSVPTNYIVLGYEPHRSNETAISKTAFGSTLFAPGIHRQYALRYKMHGYEVDLEGIVEALIRYSKQPFPVRLIGFPAYTYFLLQKLQTLGLKFQFKKGSKVCLGGGWKQFYTQRVEKEELYELIEEYLGIKDVVEFFGAVEHPILYCDCKHHHFHVPIYSRVIIRDVHTLEPVKYGEVGLVNLLTPMVKSVPLLSIMTDDLGVLHDGKSCGCGIESPYLEILGRVGVSDIKTCAAGASELMKGIQL